jgi:integrase/recombinase XerD
MRYLPLHPVTQALIHDYLEAAGRAWTKMARYSGRSATTARASSTTRSPDGIYKLVRAYSAQLSFVIAAGVSPSPLRYAGAACYAYRSCV